MTQRAPQALNPGPLAPDVAVTMYVATAEGLNLLDGFIAGAGMDARL